MTAMMTSVYKTLWIPNFLCILEFLTYSIRRATEFSIMLNKIIRNWITGSKVMAILILGGGDNQLVPVNQYDCS